MMHTEPGLLERVGSDLSGRYTIQRELGSGASAIVVLAQDERHHRDVAIKILRPEIVAMIGTQRFLREMEVAAGLQHPNIVPVFDSGIAGGLPFIVMPYLSGTTLRDRIRAERQLSWEDVIRIVREVADALDYAHERGVVHRDIKPANILLAGPHSYVADFGLAIATGGDDERLTGTGIAVGTAEYMSPEQATADAVIDGRSDIYALGCVLHEMLAGEPPFSGRTITELIAQHLTATPPSIHTIRQGLPPHVDMVVGRALEKAAADRYASGAALVHELESGQMASRSFASHRRLRSLVLPGVALALGIALLGTWAARQWLASRAVPLDPRRVVVFPLRTPGRGVTEQGEEVATYIGYALAVADPLKWMDGVRLLAASTGQSTAPAPDLAGLTRQAGASYYIDGDIMQRAESAVVRLALHAAAGDSVVARATVGGPLSGGVPALGVRALSQLLPALIDPGRPVDASALAQRDPEAIASFLAGEREYRAMHFERAKTHYTRAVGLDSAFALAAVKGAMVDSWLDHTYPLDFVHIALRHEASLPTSYRQLLRGLRFARLGFGDSAVASMRAAVAIDPPSSAAWNVYGDVLYHQLPSITGTDSLAETAYRRAREIDPQFTPPLFHLAELSMRRGDLRYWDSVLVARDQGLIDLEEFSELRQMRDCLAGPAPRQRKEGPPEVFAALAAGKVLAAGGAQPACARMLLSSVLAAPSADVRDRWGALLALQSLLVAVNDSSALDSLLHAPSVRDLPAWVPLVMNATGAGIMREEADSVARDQGNAWPTMRASHVWVLGVWHAAKGDMAEGQRALQALRVKRDSTQAPTDSLFVQLLEIRTTLASGDSARAIAQLRALSPRGSPADIAWQPWQALAGERMLLADLLVARGEHAEAMRTASLIDALEPVIHLVYLRRSLELRARAAEQLSRTSLARAYRARLSALSSRSLAPRQG